MAKENADMEMIKLKWYGNGSKWYDGKVNLERVANEKDVRGSITVSERVKVRWVQRGKETMWQAEVFEFPVEMDTRKRRNTAGKETTCII